MLSSFWLRVELGGEEGQALWSQKSEGFLRELESRL